MNYFNWSVKNIELIHKLQNRIRKPIFRDRQNAFEYFNDEEFRQRYGFLRHSFLLVWQCQAHFRASKKIDIMPSLRKFKVYALCGFMPQDYFKLSLLQAS